jgi:hypothetical protein
MQEFELQFREREKTKSVWSASHLQVASPVVVPLEAVDS